MLFGLAALFFGIKGVKPPVRQTIRVTLPGLEHAPASAPESVPQHPGAN
jgi:hypothetical protein